MATGPEAIEAIGKAVSPGIPAGTVVTTARALRDAGPEFWPMAGRGGGKNAAHVEKHHLANLLMALAASQPAEAVAAVRVLRGLVYSAREVVYRSPAEAPEGNPHTQLTGQVQDQRTKGAFFEIGSLGYALEHMIAEGADTPMREALATHRTGLELLFCVEPASAEFAFYTSDGIWRDHFQAPGQDLPFTQNAKMQERRGSRRTTILTYEIVTVAGALWSDTADRHLAGTTPSLLSQAVPNARARRGNARAAVPTATRALTSYPSEGHAKAES
ncbi:hypothetical protein [Roseomonas haemaphysalidis]|uniref:Uncharacterized protein n=1 Tax=Roseomonas haemaphysalidis TaxID=2768162 RepID=A0ABS3KWJ8_9PROT|nr:hypothetical protein [Roseomonas haemaphysalidis]MBO1081852.1 hypothetical protein [Roseomonas haemaphysalidis]